MMGRHSRQDVYTTPSQLALEMARNNSAATVWARAAVLVAAVSGSPAQQAEARVALEFARLTEYAAWNAYLEAAAQSLPSWWQRDLYTERARALTSAFLLPWPPPRLEPSGG
jgi:hypothetical protein